MKTSLFLLLCVLSAQHVFSQADSKAISLSGSYSILKRPGLDNYLKTTSDTLHLNGDLKASPEYGIGIQYLARKEKAEFEGAMTFGFARTVLSGDTDSYQVLSKVNDFGMRLGGNYFPVKFFLIGGQLVLNSFSGDLKTFHELPASVATVIEPPPSTNFNIFRGFSFLAQAQAGFNIPFSPDKYSGMRLLAYYDIGSKYRFFDASENRFAGYSGDKKTTSSGYGVSLAFYFPISGN